MNSTKQTYLKQHQYADFLREFHQERYGHISDKQFNNLIAKEYEKDATASYGIMKKHDYTYTRLRTRVLNAFIEWLEDNYGYVVKIESLRQVMSRWTLDTWYSIPKRFLYILRGTMKTKSIWCLKTLMKKAFEYQRKLSSMTKLKKEVSMEHQDYRWEREWYEGIEVSTDSDAPVRTLVSRNYSKKPKETPYFDQDINIRRNKYSNSKGCSRNPSIDYSKESSKDRFKRESREESNRIQNSIFISHSSAGARDEYSPFNKYY